MDSAKTRNGITTLGETNSAEVAARLEKDRKDLLDLTFRNPLLNYRLLKARGLTITGMRPSALFVTLVVGGRKLGFIPNGESQSEPDDLGAQTDLQSHDDISAASRSLAGPTATDAPSARRHSQNLQTPHPPADLEKRLLNTYYTAKTLIEEEGINTLYLALGILKWYEDDNSSQERASPLVLVPIELERTAAGDRFVMKYSDQDVGDNASLIALMSNEHGIKIPETTINDDFELDEYFRNISILTSRKKRWTVDDSSAAIGFFSFGKYQMYKDLEAEAWPEEHQPCDHPVLQALLGIGFRDAPSELNEETNIDKVLKVTDGHSVMDSDSSQTIAILDVLSGRHIVIQGPPGTGKSQTITKIIAECIMQGKRVLFVAEKMAALDVVKDRLTRLEARPKSLACLA